MEVNKNGSIVMPLIVVENESQVEIRDSLLRSIKSENTSSNNLEQDSKSDGRSEWTLKDRSGGSIRVNGRDVSGKGRESFG